MECNQCGSDEFICNGCGEMHTAKDSNSRLIDGLCDIKSQVARDAIAKITNILKDRLAEHYDESSSYLVPEALEEYKHDFELLLKLGT